MESRCQVAVSFNRLNTTITPLQLLLSIIKPLLNILTRHCQLIPANLGSIQTLLILIKLAQIFFTIR